MCPLKVYDIEDGKAYVKNLRDCTMCRECIREEEFASYIELGKKREHYHCNFFCIKINIILFFIFFKQLQ